MKAEELDAITLQWRRKFFDGKRQIFRISRVNRVNIVNLCYAFLSFLQITIKTTFVVPGELFVGILKLLCRVFLCGVRGFKMADQNKNTIDNINNINQRKNFICGVVEGKYFPYFIHNYITISFYLFFRSRFRYKPLKFLILGVS